MTLYGLKLSGAVFRAFLAKQLENMRFKSSIVDTYIWIRPATKAYVEQYYEFTLVYVENLLAISQDTVLVIKEVSEKFKLKKDKIEPPEIYLGGQLARKELNVNQLWTIISVDYVKAVANNL